MAVTEADIAKVMKLVPTCLTVDTVGCLLKKNELQHLAKEQIYEALHTLAQRGHFRGEGLFRKEVR